MENSILIITTVDNIKNAKEISKYLIENYLAACCNIIPKMTSIYRWEGKITEDEEALILIKTTKDLYEKIEDEIKKLNLYEIPEIISFDISNGNDEYLSWLMSSVI